MTLTIPFPSLHDALVFGAGFMLGSGIFIALAALALSQFRLWR